MILLDKNGLKHVWDKILNKLNLKQDKINSSGILKGTGNGTVVEAIKGTDYPDPVIYKNDSLMAPNSSYKIVSQLIEPVSTNAGNIGTSSNRFGNTYSRSVYSLNILPEVTAGGYVGNKDLRWNAGYINQLLSDVLRQNENTSVGSLGISSQPWNYAYLKEAVISNTARPEIDNTLALGTSSRVWKKAYVQTIESNRVNGDNSGHHAMLQLFGYPDATTENSTDKRNGTVSITVRDAIWENNANKFTYGTCNFKLNSSNQISFVPSANSYGSLGTSDLNWGSVFSTGFVGNTFKVTNYIHPPTNNTAYVGTSDYRFKGGYFGSLDVSDKIIPTTDNTQQIGTSARNWSIIHTTKIQSNRTASGNDGNSTIYLCGYAADVTSSSDAKRKGQVNITLKDTYWDSTNNEAATAFGRCYFQLNGSNQFSFIPESDGYGKIGYGDKRWLEGHFNTVNSHHFIANSDILPDTDKGAVIGSKDLNFSSLYVKSIGSSRPKTKDQYIFNIFSNASEPKEDTTAYGTGVQLVTQYKPAGEDAVPHYLRFQASSTTTSALTFSRNGKEGHTISIGTSALPFDYMFSNQFVVTSNVYPKTSGTGSLGTSALPFATTYAKNMYNYAPNTSGTSTAYRVPTFMSGTGSPTSSQGNNGDIYIQYV